MASMLHTRFSSAEYTRFAGEAAEEVSGFWFEVLGAEAVTVVAVAATAIGGVEVEAAGSAVAPTPRISFFTLTVAFSILEAPRVRR